ncbi:MAG TPA: helix-turn-helix domain-containing protein [Deltaproteobacteria bacterium]|nr:helix-turn-helix domain-containing protein [Deltaproteobacteria bacterium]
MEGEYIKEQNGDRKEGQSLFGLRELRESKEISFREIVKATRISPLMLEAIEGDDFSRLPEPVYTRAFIKAYARVLDIDPAPALEQYDAYSGVREIPENRYEQLKKRRSRPSGLPRLILAVLILCLVLVAFWYAWEQRSLWYPEIRQILKKEVSEPVPVAAPDVEETITVDDGANGVSEPVSVERNIGSDLADEAVPETVHDEYAIPEAVMNGDSAEPQSIGIGEMTESEELPHQAVAAEEEVPVEETVSIVETEPAVPAPSEGQPEKLVLEIRARGLTWLQVIRDEELPEQMYLKEGASVTWTAEEQFDIIIGNAGSTEVIFQGSSLGSLGKQGEVVFLTLP